MKLNLILTKEILDYENEIGLELIVTERVKNASSRAGLSRYYVCFNHLEVMRNGCPVTSCGNADTIDSAIKDYCRLISCERVAINAYTNQRREMVIPKLIHTKLING